MNNKIRHPKLPSISTILTSAPSPPRIIIVEDKKDEEQRSIFNNDTKDALDKNLLLLSPRCNAGGLSATLSPILSPIDSYASSVNSLSPGAFQPPSPLPSPAMLSLPPTSHGLPPLQGDDPPRRLKRHPSVCSITPNTNPSPKPAFNSLWTSSSTPNSPNTQYSNYHHSRSSSFSNDQASPTMMSIDSSNNSRSPSPIPLERLPLPPSTQIVLSESGQPILKRRRGRPPNIREPALEGGWTFLTPTVWDVNQQQQQQQQQQSTTDNTSSSAISPMNNNNNALTTTTTADSIMNGSMAAFTSSNMDMVLQMPRKKRGRKPKTHIVGNSCFVWKDITATRRSTKVIKEQQQQKAALRRLEQAATSPSNNNNT